MNFMADKFGFLVKIVILYNVISDVSSSSESPTDTTDDVMMMW